LEAEFFKADVRKEDVLNVYGGHGAGEGVLVSGRTPRERP
jgi:hypothetical protein